MNLTILIVTMIAGLGAGIATGLAGLSAAAVITPMLVTLLGFNAYEAVGISRSFFYSFFPTKEDLIAEILYLQQPKIVAYAQNLMQDPALGWHDAVRRFLLSCCYGEKHGIAVLSIEEQQALFRRLSKQSRIFFREKQRILFGKILEAFEIPPHSHSVDLFINLSLSVMLVCRAIPQSLPLFVPEAAEQTVAVQIELLTNWLETLRPGAASQRD